MAILLPVNQAAAFITQYGVREFMRDFSEQLKDDFSRWDSFDKSPRHATHYSHGVIELMPISDHEYYSFKYVNGHPYNPKEKKLTVGAFGVFSEVVSGYPLLISEMTLLTAIRTAVTSAVASQYLMRKNARTMALIGCGSQAEFQALAHAYLCHIQTIRYFDIDPEAMKKFSNNLKDCEIELIPCDSIQSAIQEADIITTVTADKNRATILKDSWIQPGVHINGVGGDCPGKTELDAHLLTHSKIVVEYLEQSTIEGEIQHLSSGAVYAELWELISGLKPGRESNDEITLFDSVGFALEDFSILKFLYELALKNKLGEKVELIPELENPKDLFCLLRL